MIVTFVFPAVLRLDDITPVSEKGSKTSKEYFGPVSILPNVSKIFERILFQQMCSYFDNSFWGFQCDFRQELIAHCSLISVAEKLENVTDKGETFATLLTGLLKAFDSLPHDLIIAKLNAYGFSLDSSRLIHSYLSNRKQGTSINTSYSSWEETLFRVLLYSIPGTSFNIFMCNLFFSFK